MLARLVAYTRAYTLSVAEGMYVFSSRLYCAVYDTENYTVVRMHNVH